MNSMKSSVRSQGKGATLVVAFVAIIAIVALVVLMFNYLGTGQQAPAPTKLEVEMPKAPSLPEAPKSIAVPVETK